MEWPLTGQNGVCPLGHPPRGGGEMEAVVAILVILVFVWLVTDQRHNPR